MEKRYGRFTVTQEVVEKNPEEWAAILAEMQFVPLRVERMYDNYGFDCIGYSPLFDEVEEGMIPPEYRINVTRTDTKSLAGIVIPHISLAGVEKIDSVTFRDVLQVEKEHLQTESQMWFDLFRRDYWAKAINGAWFKLRKSAMI